MLYIWGLKGSLNPSIGNNLEIDIMASYEELAMQEYAFNVGMDNPEDAWILTPMDAWYPNPHYKGERVPHPEAPYLV